MLQKKSNRSRLTTEISTGSMADIAFLLLIFFLVTTTIQVEKGILHQLPPWTEEEPPEAEKNDRNMFVVLINANDQLLVEGQQMKVDNLKEKSKRFIDNRGKREDLSDSPDEAVISLQNDRGTSYDMYIQVQNELKAAYNEVRDEWAMQQYGRKMDNLPGPKQDSVKDEYPMKLSEAEPKQTAN
jgi:biopolymer transport protein ExbD